MITSVIFSSILFVLFVLYLIGYFRKINVLQKISFPFLIPCSAGIVVPVFLSRMPDSFHVLVISSIAVGISVLQVWTELLSISKKNAVEQLFFALSNLVWIILFSSIFYIVRLPVFIPILFGSIYVCILVYCLIRFKIKSLKNIFNILILSSFCFALNFIAAASLINSVSFHSVLLFLGTVFLIVFEFSYLSARFKTLIKNSRIILNLLLLFGEFCIYASSVFMQI